MTNCSSLHGACTQFFTFLLSCFYTLISARLLISGFLFSSQLLDTCFPDLLFTKSGVGPRGSTYVFLCCCPYRRLPLYLCQSLSPTSSFSNFLETLHSSRDCGHSLLLLLIHNTTPLSYQLSILHFLSFAFCPIPLHYTCCTSMNTSLITEYHLFA